MRALFVLLSIFAAACSVTLEFDGLSGGASDGGVPSECDSSEGCKVTDSLEPGSIGSGTTPNWKSLPAPEISGGFLDGDQLVFAVRWAGSSNDGGVMTVDLATGHRELIAGQITKLDGTTESQGGSGPYLNNLRAARKLQDGTWAALQWHGVKLEGYVYNIDPALQYYDSGTRLGGPACDTVELAPTGGPPALGATATMWLPYEGVDTTDGVLRITATECEPIELGSEDLKALAEHDGKLWFTDESSSLSVLDPVTKLVTKKVSGVGKSAFALSADEAWTVDQAPSLLYTRAVLPSGSVSPLTVLGRAALRVEHTPNVWIDGQRLVVALDGAITLIDIGTGTSEIISY